jgi:hypothetical protein
MIVCQTTGVLLTKMGKHLKNAIQFCSGL